MCDKNDTNGTVERVYAHGLIDLEFTGEHTYISVLESSTGHFVRIPVDYGHLCDIRKAVDHLIKKLEESGCA